MKILKLQLENFRNYESYLYEFDMEKPLVLILGENGKGKTNLLEAIYLLSLGRSFRTNHPDNLIKWEKDFFRCFCTVESQNETFQLEVGYSNHPVQKKNYKKNDVRLKNSEYLGNLLTVLFHPEDLNMLYLSPAYRRNYLDIMLCQVDKNYLFALAQYKKILKQRTVLLYSIRDHRFKKLPVENLLDDLSSWDEQLVKFGLEIIEKRQKLVDFLNQKLTKIYQNIAGQNDEITVKYLKSATPDYQMELESMRDKDIRDAKTNIGPHRDDLKFCINNLAILSTASRGEFRTLLLALKLAEIDFIKEKTGILPILLLDDVFSELDQKRALHLLDAVKDHQTIIATTDLRSLENLEEKAICITIA